MKILTAEQMRQVEEQCAQNGLPVDALMENAGRAVAEAVKKLLGGVRQDVVILVGTGNNGGDGLVAGRYLHDWGARVTLYLLGQRPPNDRNLALAQQKGIFVMEAAQDTDLGELERRLRSAGVVVDAVFGTGKNRPLRGVFSAVLHRVKEVRLQKVGLAVVALDVPSGLDANTGAVDPSCLHADVTVTLGFPKPGLFNLPGLERAGRIEVVDIGIPAHLADGISTRLVTGDWVSTLLPRRPLVANKGTFGRVMVVAGSFNYVGAAFLACSGAMRVGAGLVTLATARSLHPVMAAKLTEVTHLPLPEFDPGVLDVDGVRLLRGALGEYSVLLLGCGLGQSEATVRFVKSLLFRGGGMKVPMVIDADGLNILSRTRQWWRRLPDDAILTPHPGEMARLTGMAVEQVQSDRLGVTKQMAQDWHKTVVLKGAHTVVAAPDGRLVVSPFANPGLASAGSGDVLAGAIAGLVAQGTGLFEAAACGVYLHGKAGQMVAQKLGIAGMIAGDLLPVLPLAIKRTRGLTVVEESHAVGG